MENKKYHCICSLCGRYFDVKAKYISGYHTVKCPDGVARLSLPCRHHDMMEIRQEAYERGVDKGYELGKKIGQSERLNQAILSTSISTLDRQLEDILEENPL